MPKATFDEAFQMYCGDLRGQQPAGRATFDRDWFEAIMENERRFPTPETAWFDGDDVPRAEEYEDGYGEPYLRDDYTTGHE